MVLDMLAHEPAAQIGHRRGAAFVPQGLSRIFTGPNRGEQLGVILRPKPGRSSSKMK